MRTPLVFRHPDPDCCNTAAFTICGPSPGPSKRVRASDPRNWARCIGYLGAPRVPNRFIAHHPADSETCQSRGAHLAHVAVKEEAPLPRPHRRFPKAILFGWVQRALAAGAP